MIQAPQAQVAFKAQRMTIGGKTETVPMKDVEATAQKLISTLETAQQNQGTLKAQPGIDCFEVCLSTPNDDQQVGAFTYIPALKPEQSKIQLNESPGVEVRFKQEEAPTLFQKILDFSGISTAK